MNSCVQKVRRSPLALGVLLGLIIPIHEEQHMVTKLRIRQNHGISQPGQCKAASWNTPDFVRQPADCEIRFLYFLQRSYLLYTHHEKSTLLSEIMPFL